MKIFLLILSVFSCCFLTAQEEMKPLSNSTHPSANLDSIPETQKVLSAPLVKRADGTMTIHPQVLATRKMSHAQMEVHYASILENSGSDTALKDFATAILKRLKEEKGIKQEEGVSPINKN